MSRVALAVTVLVAACVLPARAALDCQPFTATLAQGSAGGCTSTTATQAQLVIATNGTTVTTVVFTGPQPTSGGAGVFDFLAGTDYAFTATGSDGSTCSGTAIITPCTPVCKDITVSVTATSPSSACTVSIGANIFDTSANGFFDTASLGSTATTAVLTAPNGTSLPAPQSYGPGSFSVQGQVQYPNGLSEKSTACTITVLDDTAYTLPSLSNTTCFFLNTTKFTNIDIPVSLLAGALGGASCKGSGVVAIACTPEFKNKSRKRRLCLPSFIAGNPTRPTQPSSVDLLKKNFQKNPQPIVVTLSAISANGVLTGANITTNGVRVFRGKPSKKVLAAGCTPVFNRI